MDCEYCELWWSAGYRPLLTFYRPTGTESVAVEENRHDADSWDVLQQVMVDLGLNGWELLSAAQHSGALFFRRRLH